jgi:N-acetylmuramate 1-kinase
MDKRLELLGQWLKNDLRLSADHIAPASVDASFRRYFRVWRGEETFIVMDAPPEKEDTGPFTRIARMLADVGVHVPRILDADTERGFLLITDLGTRIYLDDLSAYRTGGDQVDSLYDDATRALCAIQARGLGHAAELPPYDRAALTREMDLFPEWFCIKHLKLDLSDADREMIATTFDALCRSALEQPQVFVHRDYHSRNLMVCNGSNPGILDFQDAVRGAITYDLVSLFKDCYIRWPKDCVRKWVVGYRARVLKAGLGAGESDDEFLRWFHLMGAQRHIKVLGIFARLYHRDGKPRYLHDLPLTLDYVREICPNHPELHAIGKFLEKRVVPILRQRTEEALG